MELYKEIEIKKNGLRLNYVGTGYVMPGTKAKAGEEAVAYAIRFTSDDTEAKVVKSMVGDDIIEEMSKKGLQVQDVSEWGYPYTGTGFISSTDELTAEVPGKVIKEGTDIIPEYLACRDKKEALVLNNGAEMYKITEDGKEILVAVFDRTEKKFFKIGE